MSYKFSLDFQKHILASVLSDERFLRENADVIKPEYFGDEVLSGIAQAAIDFHRAHQETPTKAGLHHELKAVVAPGRKHHEYVDGLAEVWDLIGRNSGYYQEQAVAFARSQAVAGALRNAAPLLEQGDVDEIGRAIQDALKVGAWVDSDGVYDYFASAPDRVRSYLNDHEDTGRLATGFTTLDEECMSGGLGQGEIGVMVGLAGHGKTTMLVNLGARALLQDKNVVYVTLELSKKMIAAKFDTCLFGSTMDKIRNEPREFATALKGLRDKLTGRLHVVEFPTKGLTVERMGAIVQKIGKVDLVLVDYGQLIKPTMRRDEVRHELSEIYYSLRRMAGELKVPLWTAHQANRPGTQSTVIRSEHVAEDFNIVGIVDIGVSINYTDEELRRGALRLYVMKSRIGASGIQFECAVNWKIGKVTLAH